MSLKRYQYALPRHANGGLLPGILREAGLDLRIRPPVAVERVWYDSFDWRLYAAGLLLFVDHAGARRHLILRGLDDGIDIVGTGVTDQPCFAGDLPDGLLRRRVAPVLGDRRLLDRARLKARFHGYDVLDEQAKTVARLCMERYQVFREDGRLRRLRDRVAVVPVRGYGEWLERLREVFEQTLAWDRIHAPVLDEALTALGRRPLDYSTKPAADFDPAMPAGEAARLLFSALLGIIEANEDGVRHDYDSNFLHDLRVATRRTRALLVQMKPLLAGPRFEHFRNEFAWLGAMTGPVRDLDVHLAALPDYVALAAGGADDDVLASLQTRLRRERAQERRGLLEVLASPRYRNLKRAWRALLDDAGDDVWLDGAAGFPVSAAIPAIVRDRHDKVLKRGHALSDDAPDAEYHELRKACKKLRYLIEGFSGLFPRDEIRPLVRALKALQNDLGEFQDLCVHAEYLQRCRDGLPEDDAAAQRSAAAIGRILDGIERRKHDVRKSFASSFRRFAEVSDRKHLQTMFERTAMAASA